MPIIALTANVYAEQVAGFLEAGMNDHVGKPMERGGPPPPPQGGAAGGGGRTGGSGPAGDRRGVL